jgi:antitoxin (DNA-binding transcriptional repressor) of toxin-antitoxin stability system
MGIMAAINATKLRTNLYAVLDEVLKTGTPVEIVRKGRRLRIVPEHQVRKTDALIRHPGTVDDPEAIVHPDWSGLWDPDRA